MYVACYFSTTQHTALAIYNNTELLVSNYYLIATIVSRVIIQLVTVEQCEE